MKFAHYLTTIAKDAPVEWQDKFLKYKLLKKLLKACHEDCEGDCEVCSHSQALFFDELHRQLHAANRQFAGNANKIIDTFHSQQQPGLCCFLRSKRNSQRKSAELAQRAYWCRKYARANAVALRKILKKYDKCCRSTAGREFLQECWKSDASSGVGIFLHSPLLDELKAIQDVLLAQVPPEDPDLIEQPPTCNKSELRAAATKLQEQQVQQQLPARAGNAEAVKGSEDDAAMATDKGALPQLVVLTGAAAPALLLGRESLNGSGLDCGMSFTRPSLRQQQQRALSAVVESPTCMLNTADIEWCASPVRGGAAAAGGGGGMQLRVEPHASSAPFSSLDSESGSGGGSGMDTAGRAHAASAAAAARAHEDGPAVVGGFTEDELRCPICLDVMYKPVGLACGHKFCRHCALEAAGLGRAVGAFHNLLSYIPSRTKCPQCRQPGMYKGAVVLREVGKLIQCRYPQEWAERRAEEKARAKALAAEFTSSQRHMIQSRNAYDLLFSI